MEVLPLPMPLFLTFSLNFISFDFILKKIMVYYEHLARYFLVLLWRKQRIY